MPSKSSKWELGFVHYIAKFTILRFVIPRFECTKKCIKFKTLERFNNYKNGKKYRLKKRAIVVGCCKIKRLWWCKYLLKDSLLILYNEVCPLKANFYQKTLFVWLINTIKKIKTLKNDAIYRVEKLKLIIHFLD